MNDAFYTHLCRMVQKSLTLLLLACGAFEHEGTPAGLPYALNEPTRVFTLPQRLVEVSALTDVDSATVACVQDEAATIFFVSLIDGQVVRETTFGEPGDMEGLTRVGEDYFALRSDGLIYHLRPSGSTYHVVDTFRLDVPNRNIEGLGYDEGAGLVLVSPKDFSKGSPAVRDERVLYGFDPLDPQHRVREVLSLSVEKLIAEARSAGVELPTRKTEGGRVVSAVKLRWSSVAVHPFSHLYYFLSAVDRTLLVVDRSGAFVALELLDPELLPKPEGITFLANGDLVLSSEGKGRAPVIARYTYKL